MKAEIQDWNGIYKDLGPIIKHPNDPRTHKSETIATMPRIVWPPGQPSAFDDNETAELLADALQEECTASTQSTN